MDKRLYVSLIAAVALCSCRSNVKISGRLIGADVSEVYLEQVSSTTQSVIDTVSLAQDGAYCFEIKGAGKSPLLYNIVYGGERIPLFLAGGDRVKVSSVGSIVRNYTVEGSAESETLRTFYQPFVAGAQTLDRIAMQVAAEGLDESERERFVKEYTDEYYRIRREQLRFIIENKASLAAVYALYQRLRGDQSLFNGESDVIYYRTVAEAIEERYPDSPYLQMLQNEVARMEKISALAGQITETSYPDLELTDIYGKKIRLSSLAGKVVLVDFWSAELGNSNALNADLKQTYERFAGANVPFEVYQIAIDTSKSAWVTAVQEQRLPWISVSDLRGRASSVLSLYNVRKLPANFLIDSKGNIVAKDIYGKSLDARLEALTR